LISRALEFSNGTRRLHPFDCSDSRTAKCEPNQPGLISTVLGVSFPSLRFRLGSMSVGSLLALREPAEFHYVILTSSTGRRGGKKWQAVANIRSTRAN
jgi:hypothetical protein